MMAEGNKTVIPEENDIGVRAMKRALKAQEDFENAMDKGEFNLHDFTIIKSFLKYLKPYWKIFLFGILLDVVITGGFVLIPRIEGIFIDKLPTPANPTVSFGTFSWLIGAYCIVIAIITVAQYYNGIIFYTVGQKVVTDIRDDLFRHVESLSLAQIDSLPVGKYITRITNDCRGLSSFFTDMIVNMVRDILNVIMTLTMAFFLSWKLSLILVAFLPLVFLVSYVFRKETKKYYRDQRRQRSEINGFLSENISGIRTIKTFDREPEQCQQFGIKNQALKKSYMKAVNLSSFYRPSIYFMQISAMVLVIYVAMRFVVAKDVVPFSGGDLFGAGEVYTFIYGYTSSFFQPIQDMAELFNSLQNVLTSAERVGALMSVKPSVENDEKARPLESWEAIHALEGQGQRIEELSSLSDDRLVSMAKPEQLKVKGDIEFRHVWFAYLGQEWVLKDVSFHVYPGETAAFVGATGAGKSTIIGLIVRNMVPQRGQILIDGVDVNLITIESLRSNISQMMQDVFLFSGTISENISLFAQEPDQTRIKESCELVGADGFIKSLDGGYGALVRERGNNFSVGQRQLISFARAVYHKPSVMVLDEATANIDTETENLIQHSLKKMRSLGTMVIVAHRLSTIQDADCIYVVEKGKIVESGKHNELLKKKGLYYSMYKLQDLERSLDYNKVETAKA